jgi:uncharacterized protein YjbI with pentapeptide repeats
MTKTDYDPDRSLVLIEGLSHFITNVLQNLASCQTSFKKRSQNNVMKKINTSVFFCLLPQSNFLKFNLTSRIINFIICNLTSNNLRTGVNVNFMQRNVSSGHFSLTI